MSLPVFTVMHNKVSFSVYEDYNLAISEILTCGSLNHGIMSAVASIT